MALHGATLALARSVSALVYDLNLPDAGKRLVSFFSPSQGEEQGDENASDCAGRIHIMITYDGNAIRTNIHSRGFSCASSILTHLQL